MRLALPSSTERVPRNTAAHVNSRIRHATLRTLSRYRGASPKVIERRLARLDREWDIERAIEANAGVAGMVGLVLAVVNPAWLILTAAVLALLFVHALQGWCPPVPILRRLGFRTRTEIDAERRVLLSYLSAQPEPPAGRG